MQSSIKIKSFLRRPQTFPSLPFSRLKSSDPLFNVVIIKLPDSCAALQQIEDHCKPLSVSKCISLWKITELHSFASVYTQMLGNNRVTYFITDRTLEVLEQDPFAREFKSTLRLDQYFQVLSRAEENLKKIRFIIFHDKPLHSRNYLHPNTCLVADSPITIKDFLSRQANKFGALCTGESTSDLCSEDERKFQKIPSEKNFLTPTKDKDESLSSADKKKQIKEKEINEENVETKMFSLLPRGPAALFGTGAKQVNKLPKCLTPGPGQYEIGNTGLGKESAYIGPYRPRSNHGEQE